MKAMLLALVTLCTACSKDYPQPTVGLKEATCKSATLLAHLGNNESLVKRVLLGELTLEDAVYFVGGFEGDAQELRNDLRFPRLCARLGLVEFWMATGKWPDCADEVPYDFRAECARVQGVAKEAFGF